jgi:GntR family histidine utilization transcriptional repressor
VEIQRELEGNILSGAWPPGTRVPSEDQLTQQFGCSRMTVNKALSTLATAGLITRKRRAGTIVATPQYKEAVLEIQDIKGDITAAGRAYRHEVFTQLVRRANAEDAGRLGIIRGARVVFLEICHFDNDRPIVLERRLINASVVPGADRMDFSTIPPGTWLLQQIPWTQAEHRIRAENAEAPTASRLKIKRNAACLVIQRKTWRAGVPITWAELVHPGEGHELLGRFSPSGFDPRPV